MKPVSIAKQKALFDAFYDGAKNGDMIQESYDIREIQITPEVSISKTNNYDGTGDNPTSCAPERPNTYDYHVLVNRKPYSLHNPYNYKFAAKLLKRLKK